jgi:signal transduction histidine kinase
METAPPLSVLLVEDHPAVAQQIQALLGDHYPCRITWAPTLTAARTQLQAAAVDCILLDLGLPDSQGLDTVAHVAQEYPALPIVVLTAHDDALARAALTAGAEDYLSKSTIEPGMLVRAIRYACERKRAEVQLRQAQKMEALGMLAGGIAHDFNNLLSSLIGRIELATDDVPQTNPAWAHLQDALAVAHRATGLVRQILTFSRRRGSRHAPVALAGLVADTLPLIRGALPSPIEIRQKIDPTVGAVLADPVQLQQVLMNLCSNAEHAMGAAGGVLEVRLEPFVVDAAFAAAHPPLEVGTHVRLVIGDTGHGMPPKIQARMFDPFFTTKAPGEGTGMGLAVVHGIVARHGGAIVVESSPGRGTTVAVYLPQCATAAAAPGAEERPVRGTGQRILIIEDDAALARLWGEMLETLGYQTRSCASSIAGLELVRTAPDAVDLVVADLVMLHMSGDQLAEELLRLRPDLPIILCSGNSPRLTAQRATARGIRVFLQKPVDRRQLGLAVQQALRQHTPGESG